jgi:PAS domain S-box-containing protein
MESFFTLIHPEDREAVERATVTAIVDNIPYSLEHRIVRLDGSVKWVHAQADIMRDAEGRLAQIIGIIQDITAHREAKERVRRSERRYHTLVHASPVGIFHTDAQGECIYVNERWCELTGLKAEEACGSGWTRALHPGDRERITKEWYAVAKQHRLFNSVYRYLRPDGRIIWVYGQAAGEESETGEIIGYVGTVTDITEQKQIEQRLLQQQGELCHAQRLITIGELAGVMAHELNQPLGAIANYLEGAIIRYGKEFKSNPELGKVLKHTLRLVERATHIIRNIRTLVRKQDLNWQPVDINTLIRETVRLIGAEAARRQVRITLDLALNIQPLWGHRIHLQQLLLNLILNGMEAMEAIDTKSQRLIIQTLSTDHTIEIRVTDTGVGFGEELAARLFEPFMTTKKDGVGLGLSICRTIVEAHGGEISADSRPGQGATFRVTLPTDRRSHERDPN